MGPISKPHIVHMKYHIVQWFGAAFWDFVSGPKMLIPIPGWELYVLEFLRLLMTDITPRKPSYIVTLSLYWNYTQTTIAKGRKTSFDFQDLMHVGVHRSSSTVRRRPLEAGGKPKNVQKKIKKRPGKSDVFRWKSFFIGKHSRFFRIRKSEQLSPTYFN